MVQQKNTVLESLRECIAATLTTDTIDGTRTLVVLLVVLQDE